MSSHKTQILSISTGIILLKNKIASHTYHIKIQSLNFSQIQSVTGSAIEIYHSNPHYDPHTETKQYAFWDYEPIYHIADFTVTVVANNGEKKWIENLQKGDTIFFKPLTEALILDYTADHYLLISDVKALSHLYEINRTLPVSKTVTALVYAEREEDLFPDLDHSFPVKSCITTPIDAEKILKYIREYAKKDIQNGIVYVLGDSPISAFIYNDLKDRPASGIRDICLSLF